MPTFFPVSLPRPKVRWRRVLLVLAGALLLFQVLVNVLLATGGLAGLLNRLIPRTELRWRQAWSFVPGRVHLRDFSLRREEPNNADWRLDIDRVWVDVSLTGLLLRRFETVSVDVRGVRAHIHTVTPKKGEPPPPPPPREKAPWRIHLKDVRVHGVHEFVWNGARLTGITQVSGNLDLQPGERILMEDARVSLGPGELSIDEDTVAHVEGGTAGATLEVRRQEPEGLDIITGLTEGRLQLTARVPSASAFRRLVPRLADLHMSGGAGRVEVDLHVKEGRVAAGTSLKGAGEPLRLPVGPLVLKAPWRFASDVYTREDGEQRLGFKLTLGPARLEGGQGPAVGIPEVALLMSARPPRLGSALPDVHLQVQAARSEPVELRLLNGWIGPSFQVESGRALLEASSHASPEKGRGEAHLSLSTEGLRAHWGGATLGGRVLLDVDAYKLAFQRDAVVLDGSQLRLEEVTVRTGGDDARGWDGTLAFPEATLALSPPSFRGRFTGRFSNAVPFIALLTHQGVLPRILSPLLAAKDLELSGTLSLGEAGVKVEALRARGQGLDVRGRVSSTGGVPSALMLVKLGVLPVGVEVGATASLQLMNPQSWYTQKTGEPVE
ncbi:hypothetical protein [Cystobacter fuscus]|uniref:hypothetical protein n=1 Tax=Cystobacter fuscus TaxID=43 RepID=UPI002B2F1169|nr:hypothetical protein F0U63_23680 [Cystobacter fuscus]